MDNLRTPCKGDPITAEWARRITDHVNRTATTSPLRSPGIQRPPEGPSDYAFKVTRNVDDDSKLWICLPWGCLTYGKAVIDAAKGLEAAKRNDWSHGTSPMPVRVDGRFNSVYDLQFKDGGISASGITSIYCVVKNGSDGPEASFVAGDAAIESHASDAVALFVVAKITASKASGVEDGGDEDPKEAIDYAIQQVTRGAAHLGGAGGGAMVVTVSGGSAEDGYTGTDQSGNPIELFLPEVALGSTIPEGSKVIGHAISVTVTGGGEADE